MRYPRDLRAIRRPSPRSPWFLAGRRNSAARRGRQVKLSRGRPRSAPRTASSPSISSSTSAAAISAAMSPTPEAAVGASSVQFPAGYYRGRGAASSNISSGRGAAEIVVPVTLLIIFLLLYLNFRRLTETLIVMLSLPFALVGGTLADVVARLQRCPSPSRSASSRLAGVAAETGVIMLIYLDQR
jgi:Cu(I)/Ag(I) efflux system membrane protein CusA/SilA